MLSTLLYRIPFTNHFLLPHICRTEHHLVITFKLTSKILRNVNVGVHKA
jgi:hypothetical protein